MEENTKPFSRFIEQFFIRNLSSKENPSSQIAVSMANRIQIQELLQTEDEKLIKEMKSLFVCEQIKKIAKNSFEISFLIKKTFVKDLLTFVAI